MNIVKLRSYCAPQEIDQPHTMRGRVCVEAELSDSGAEDTFPPDLRINISEDDFCYLDRTLIIRVYVHEFSVEGILQCASTN